MKLIINALAWVSNLIGGAISFAFLFALAFGFVTIGCSQSLWTNKMACTVTLMFNSFK